MAAISGDTCIITYISARKHDSTKFQKLPPHFRSQATRGGTSVNTLRRRGDWQIKDGGHIP